MSLSIKNLSKAFGNKVIFSSFSYEFPDSGIFALSGDSGIGKTTLLRIIAGLDKDYLGEVVGGGIGRVSIAFQEHRLLPSLSALENVVFAVSDTKCEAVLRKANNLLNSLGISESDASLSSEELSGGMRQRVSLARAFIKEASVLLLDEPTKELDEGNAEAVRRMILELSKSSLVIMATHNSEDISRLGATVIRI